MDRLCLLLLALTLAAGAPAALAQREPDIVNAPHAPIQDQRQPGGDMPMEVYITPQIGMGGGAWQDDPGSYAPRRRERPHYDGYRDQGRSGRP